MYRQSSLGILAGLGRVRSGSTALCACTEFLWTAGVEDGPDPSDWMGDLDAETSPVSLFRQPPRTCHTMRYPNINLYHPHLYFWTFLYWVDPWPSDQDRAWILVAVYKCGTLSLCSTSHGQVCTSHVFTSISLIKYQSNNMRDIVVHKSFHGKKIAAIYDMKPLLRMVSFSSFLGGRFQMEP